MTTPTLFYWCAGGAVCASGQLMTMADGKALFETHLDEAQAAMLGGRSDQSLAALRLAEQLFNAMSEAETWRRAGAAT
jgi:hypothetical protein